MSVASREGVQPTRKQLQALGLLVAWLWLVLLLGGVLPLWFSGPGPALCGGR
jgi:hypothetical protein